MTTKRPTLTPKELALTNLPPALRDAIEREARAKTGAEFAKRKVKIMRKGLAIITALLPKVTNRP